VPALDDLVVAELIDEVGFTGRTEYAFRHPLIRTVAYESQLKADRAELHGRLAAALQTRHAGAENEHAALIAEHLEAAGATKTAFAWHMRAGTWSNTRDIAAAHRSWERARQLADALPGGDPDRLALRIAPRTLLCATAFRQQVIGTQSTFDELDDLCAAAGDKVSLAIGMTGQVASAMGAGRVRAATRLSTEQMGLIESIGDPNLTVSLFAVSAFVLMETGNWSEALRWSANVIDIAQGDPTRGRCSRDHRWPLPTPCVATRAGRWASATGMRTSRAGWRPRLRLAEDYRALAAEHGYEAHLAMAQEMLGG
jgi:hypothetical protein